MIEFNLYDEKREKYLGVELYSKGQPKLDLYLYDEGPGIERIELDKQQVSELIAGLVEMHKDMS